MQIHPNEISPGENFDIFYFIRNHTDSTTYFVRGVIYDVRTGAVLLTTNLTQATSNSRLFIKTVQSPPDSSGGRNIVAIATVYTDSGYTTKSTDYEEQEQYYLIKDQAYLIGGGGGGVDYQTLREMMEDVVSKKIDAMEKPKELSLPDMPFDALFGAIGALQREVNRIPKDAPDHQAALSTISAGLDEVKSLIAAIPQPEQVDIGPMSERLANLTDAFLRMRSSTTEEGDRLVKQFQMGLKDLVVAATAEAAKQTEKTLTKVIEGQEFTFPIQRSVNKQEAQPTPMDVSHLMRT